MIHQQALCGKRLKLSSILESVVSPINFIRSRVLNHRQFHHFLQEMNSEFLDLPYHTSVTWLSCGKILARSFELRSMIKPFFNKKNTH